MAGRIRALGAGETLAKERNRPLLIALPLAQSPEPAERVAHVRMQLSQQRSLHRKGLDKTGLCFLRPIQVDKLIAEFRQGSRDQRMLIAVHGTLDGQHLAERLLRLDELALQLQLGAHVVENVRDLWVDIAKVLPAPLENLAIEGFRLCVATRLPKNCRKGRPTIKHRRVILAEHLESKAQGFSEEGFRFGISFPLDKGPRQRVHGHCDHFNVGEVLPHGECSPLERFRLLEFSHGEHEMREVVEGRGDFA